MLKGITLEILHNMKNHKLKLFIQFLGALLIASTVFMLKFNVDYIALCVIIALYMVMYTINVKKHKVKEDSDLAQKNKLMFLYSGLSELAMLAGFYIERVYEGIEFKSYVVCCIIMIAIFVINMIWLATPGDDKLYQGFVLLGYMGLILASVLAVETFWIFFLPIPIISVFTIYEDKRIIYAVAVIVNAVNIIGIIRQIMLVHRFGRLEYNIYISISECILMLAYTFCVMRAFNINKQTNIEEYEKVVEKKEKTNEYSEKIISIAYNVKESAHKTSDVINQVDIATDNTLVIFDDIANGIDNNVKSVKQQAMMTAKITELIDSVRKEVDEASYSTKDSYNEVYECRNSMKNLKEKAEIIVSNNVEVINVIMKFIDNIEKVKQILVGINEISEQTDLLSLNAAIESSRVGDAGKGFANVAGEIRNLAEQTATLINDINGIIHNLEGDAYRAKKVVDDVVNAVNEENEIIDKSFEDFSEIDTSLKGLGNNITEILNKVEELVKYNANIDERIKELEDSSMLVAEVTEKTVDLNEDNKVKAKSSKDLMDKLIVLTDKIDEYLEF